MHIMHVIDQLAVGGAERVLVDLANQTAADGHDVSVCVTRSGGALAAVLRPEVDLTELGRTRRFDWRRMRKLGRIVSEQEVDLLHAHGRSSFSMLALMKTMGLLSVPLLLHDHSSLALGHAPPTWFRTFGRRQVAQYVGVCEEMGAWARRAGLPMNRVRVIGNALALARFQRNGGAGLRAEFGIAPEVPVGVVVASFRACKGIDVLLQAVARLAYRGPLQLIVFGGVREEAYAARCRELRRTLGLEEIVLFAGERTDVPSLLSEADFGVIPSRSESGPLALIEYMAAGLPFVASRVGHIAEQAEQLGLSAFTAPGSADDLAGALDGLLALDAAGRAERGAAGQAAARQHFDVQAVMSEWYEVYDQMLCAV